MENKENYLVTNDWLKKPNEIIAQMTPEQKIITHDIINQLNKVAEKELKDSIFKDNINRLEYTLPDGRRRETVISHGGKTIKTQIDKVFDYQKALQFAKDNNLNIPMLPPQVDFEKLEGEQWFQENIEKFVKYEEKQIPTISYNRILHKDKKEEE